MSNDESASTTAPEPDAAPDTQPDAAPDPETDPQPDAAPDAEPDPQPDAAPDPEPDAQPDTVSDPQADPAEEGGGTARETDVQESDPNADSAAGLAGGMGISSERVGELRGSPQEGTYGAMETHPPGPEGDLPPEQSADPATGEPHPDQPILKDHGEVSGV